MPGEPSLIKVRTDVVLDVLVPSLYEAARARAAGEGLEWLADMGRHGRAVELERFAPARARMPWLHDLLERASADRVAAELAAEEPDGRPDPPDAPSWRVPGPGGHVRYYVATLAVREIGLEDRSAGRRAWLTGFFRHCCDEALGAV